MNRRLACGLLALGTLAATFSASGQVPTSPYRVAWVSMDRAGGVSPQLEAFRAGMAELGYVEGRNVVIETWWGANSPERDGQIAAEILARKSDIVVTQGGAALSSMLRAGVAKPIVFGMSADPIAMKVAESYARPGGNVTGNTLFAAELTGKRMALLAEAVPGIRRFAVIANPLHPGESKEVQSARAVASQQGWSLQYFPVRTEAELEAALAEIARTRVEGCLVLADGFALGQAERIARFSVQSRIPVVTGWATFAERGNLLAYGPIVAEVYRGLARYVDQIRKGARPGDLPIQQPTQLEFVINIKTAKALGLAIPPSLRQRADRLIE
jgi:putative ABC transport system substrate-binding protein